MVLTGTVSHSTQPSRWWLAVAALLVVTWGWQHFFAVSQHDQRPVSVAHQTGSAQGDRARGFARVPHVATPSFIAPSTDLAAQWRDTDDLMAFIERAKIDPAAGGYYYALKAYDFCAREAKVAGRVPRIEELFSGMQGFIDVRQVNAWMRISALCRNVPESSRELNYLALTEEGQQAGDPKLALLLRLERLSAAPLESAELRDADARADLLTRIFAAHDPALMRDLARELQALQPVLNFTLDDEVLTPEDSDRVVDALMYIACAWGGTCGRIDESAALLSCAHQGVCVPLPYAADPDARLRRMVDTLLSTNGTALQFAAPRPVAAAGAGARGLKRVS